MPAPDASTRIVNDLSSPASRVAAPGPHAVPSSLFESEPDHRSAFADFQRPSLLLEQRAWLELVELLASPVYFGIGVARGDNQPVLCLPGFLGSDGYLGVLRGWLGSIGYRPYSSGFRIATGSPFVLVEQAVRRADHIATATNQRLTLIGHSLGGLIGRTVARVRPDLIAHVVTLGSPLGADPRGAAHPVVRALAHLLLRESRHPAALRSERVLERSLLCGPVPATVRVTCIYSREDAVVDWRACLETAPQTTAYAVRGTHCGLAWNGEVYRRLAQELAAAGS